ncbi:hypothetical protein ACHAXT_003494 [Thalassiosira profunda]
MAAAAAPAITPDARRASLSADRPSTGKRSVSFGAGTLKMPSGAQHTPSILKNKVNKLTKGNDGAANDDGTVSKEEALRLYAAYRSAPAQFPSYDRLRFVRLPADWLPTGLRDSSMDEATHGDEQLHHWPALVYNNLAELVKDLPKSEDRMLKAKLILQHRQHPSRVVARLMGWKRPGAAESGSQNPFDEPRLEMVHLSGTSLGDNEANHGECLSFVDHQLELEDACDELLAKHADCDAEEADGEVREYALRFRGAVDMALNCLALDVGADVLPARRDEGAAVATSKGGDVMRSSAGASGGSAAAGKKTVLDVESAKKQPSTKGRSVSDPTEKENQANKESKRSRKDYTAKGTGLKARSDSPPPQKASPKKPRAKKEKAASSSQPPAEPSRQSSRAPKPSAKSGSRALNLDDAPAAEESESANNVVEDEVSWKELWVLMKKNGWNWKGGSGLMVDYYYILPGRNVKNGTKDVDYFESAEGAQEYARSVYGWGQVSRKALAEHIEEHGKCAGETVPPLTGDPIPPHEPWKQAWERLRKSGWSWRAGSGLMMDYYYIKPGCGTKNGAEGMDYFCKLEDVQKFCKRNYGWRGEEEEKEAGDAASSGKPEALGGRLRDKPKRPLTLGGKVETAVREKRQRVATFARKVAENTAAMKQEAQAKEAADAKEAEEEDVDDDDQSTFTQSGSQPKALFANECADQDVPPLKLAIEPDEPWRDAWEKMRKSGWSWKQGSGLMVDYYYIKPGRSTKAGIKGQDYFESEDDARAFARRNYGWKGDGRSSEAPSTDPTKAGRRKKRRSLSLGNATEAEDEAGKRQKTEKAKPPRKAPKASSPESKPVPPPRPTWRELQADGWKAVSAGKYNKLHDWYYVRPGADPGEGELGVDFFLSEEDAVNSLTDLGSAAATKAEDARKERRASKETKAPTNATDAADPALTTPANCRTKPQDPAKPLLTSPESDSPPSPSEDPYQWTNLWPTLQMAGWVRMKAGKFNKLHDWYWVRPNRDPGDEATILGRHYFSSQEDVIEFVRKEDLSTPGRKKQRESVGVMLGAFHEANELEE